MKADVTNLEAKTVGSIDLDEAVFGLPVRGDILHRMVVWQLAQRRSGNHKVKTRGEIAGTTAKIRKQKGSGRARHRNSKTNIFRSGGVTFGPVVRDHATDLPKKIRKLALKTALSSKAAEGKLVVLDKLALKEPKTKLLDKKLQKLGWTSVLLIAGPELDENLTRAAANIGWVDILPSQGANVYDILRRDTLVLTTDAVSSLEARLK